jgi:hypothetical protein
MGSARPNQVQGANFSFKTSGAAPGLLRYRADHGEHGEGQYGIVSQCSPWLICVSQSRLV